MSSEHHPILNRFINYYKKLKQVKIFYNEVAYTALLSIITAPLHTISISMQLSVKPHLEIYPDQKPPPSKSDSKALIKQVTEMTLRDERNYNIIKSSGVPQGQKPYRAPIYSSYRECINSLKKQGILGFYKGNAIRLVAFASIQRGRISLDWYFREHFDMKTNSILKMFLVYTIIDILAHPLFVMESRYILQNRLPQFKIFPSIWRYKTRSAEEMFVGILTQIPKNLAWVSSNFLYFAKPSFYILLLNNLISNIMVYPILTAMRRLVSQSGSFPGLLPYRYLNILHALSLIRREEGLFKGLYKGFVPHMIAVSIWTATVPIFSRVSYIHRMEKEEDLFENDAVFKEIQRRKLENLRN
jgi:hypothetical protein